MSLENLYQRLELLKSEKEINMFFNYYYQILLEFNNILLDKNIDMNKSILFIMKIDDGNSDFINDLFFSDIVKEFDKKLLVNFCNKFRRIVSNLRKDYYKNVYYKIS